MKKLALLLAALMVLVSVPAMAEVHDTGLPISDETYTFSMMIDDSGVPEDKIIYPMLEEQTNVHVDLQLAPYQLQLEKMGIALNSGDYADVIAGWLLGDKDVIQLGMQDGVFLPLEDLIAQYAPNIQEVLDIPGVAASMTLPDGHIYTIPYVVSEPQATFKPYINQVWLENLGLEMPTTPEELKEVLIAFRDQDANGNGDTTDEIPFSGDPNNLSMGTLAGWWGVDANSGANTPYPYCALVDGKIQFNANTEEFRTAMTYFADLYAEKLIDPELFTHDLETWKAKGNQNLYGVCFAYGPGDFYSNFADTDTENREKYGENAFTALPVLAGCEKPVYHRNSYGVTLFRTQAAITDKCDEEKAKVIIRWFDNLFTRDNSQQSSSGPIGIKIEKLGEGLYRNLDTSSWTDEENEKYGWGNIFTQSLCRYYHDNKVLDVGKDEVTPGFNDLMDEIYAPYLNESFPKVWASSEEDTERVSVLATDINSYVKQKIAQWISGEADINAEWDAYVDQLNKLGLDELMGIYRRALGEE
jgi:putative aldouronate transport system substrate-binding protein